MNCALLENDTELLNLIQTEMRVVARPFAALGERLGLSEGTVIQRLQRLKTEKIIRQISAIFDTRSLGYESSLVAAKYPADHVDAAAEIINQHPGVSHNYLRNHTFNLWYTIAVSPVSHCYRRPSYPDWPYNIFTMVHGKNRIECEQTLAAISEQTGITNHSALYSTKEYKKVRVRYFTDEEKQWEHAHR